MANGFLQNLGQAATAGFLGAQTKDPTAFSRLQALKSQTAGQNLANERAELDIGFLKDTAKRKDAVQDAIQLQNLQGDRAAQERFLKQRFVRLFKEGRDPSDTKEAIQILAKNPEQFDRTINNVVKLGQAMGDISLPAGPKVPQSVQEARAIFGEESFNQSSPAERLSGIEQIAEAKKGRQTPQGSKASDFQIVEGVDEQGQPVRQRVNKLTGEVQNIESIPPPKSGESISITGPDGNTVTIARGPNAGKEITGPTKTVVTEAQKKILGYQQRLGQISNIRESLNTKFLTLPGKLKDFVNVGKEKLGFKVSDEQKQSIEEFQTFRGGVLQFLNQYIKDITGAQASFQEMDRIKKSIFNLEQSPSQFMAALDQVQGEIERSNKVMSRMLESGSVFASDKAFMSEFDNLFAPSIGVSPQARANVLRARGDLTPPQIVEQLKKEGFGN
jgi:hypothetical protein